MKTMNKDELLNISGGAIHWGIISAIIAGVMFVAGVIDGIVRPLNCN